MKKEQGKQGIQPQMHPNSSCGTYTLLRGAHYRYSCVEKKHLESTSLASYTFITLQMEKLLQSHRDTNIKSVWLPQIYLKYILKQNH
ncbi:hypothetical protein FKM82_008775 [Ascaphus truei]